VPGEITIGGGTFIGNTAIGNTTITSVSTFAGLLAGQIITGPGISAATTIVTVNSLSGNIVISAPATATGRVTIGYNGNGATWDIDVVPGVPTIFDDGSMQFNTPSTADTSSQAFDRYLLYPTRNILE
jgi:hypothetical protein